MKGLVFAGCSFTWGQGLYYYSGLDTIRYPEPNQYDRTLLTDAHIKYMESKRSARLVANHFDTFEVVSKRNGGSEDFSFMFLKQLFGIENEHTYLTNERYNFSEIEYIILQTSELTRCNYYYTNNKNEQHRFNIYDTNEEVKYNFYNWLEKELKWSYDEWYNDLKKHISNKIISELKFYESHGIKTLIYSWKNDYLDIIENNKWLLDRFITIPYFNKKYNTTIEYKCIDHLFEKEPNLMIEYDYDNFKNPPKDLHPSLECHKIISNAIIKKINKNEKNII